MRVNNAKLSFKIFFTIFTVYILSISIVVLIVMSSDLTGIMWQYVISDCCFLFINLSTIAFAVYCWGYNMIDENGITRCLLFFKKQYNWNNLQFISKSRTYIRTRYSTYTGEVCEKIVVSVKILKEDFKRKHTSCLFSKKCFYMPYSKDLESYIIAKAPVECYTYSYIVDDTTNEKYRKYIT